LKAVFASFQKHDVKYVVIGGIASVLYGVPRATFDLDILIEADPQNARRLLDALLDAQLGTAGLSSPEELLKHEITINDLIKSKNAAGREVDLKDVQILRSNDQ